MWWKGGEVALRLPSSGQLAQNAFLQRGCSVGQDLLRQVRVVDIVVDDEKAEPQTIDDEHLIRATTGSPVAARRHVVRIVGRAEETLLHWIEVKRTVVSVVTEPASPIGLVS